MIEIQQGALDRLVRCARVLSAETDAIHAILPDDAAPKRIVEVHNHCLAGFPGRREDKPEPLVGQVDQALGGDRHPHCQPLALVVPVQASMARHQGVVVEDIDTDMLSGERHKSLVDLSNCLALSDLKLCVQNPLSGL